MTLIKNLSIAAAALLMLAACDSQNPNSTLNKSNTGTVIGAVGGGLLGSQVGKGSGRLIGVGVGTLLGAALGNQVGSSLDRADMAYYNNTSQRALETAQPGQSLPWNNPQSGNSGTVTPLNYYQTANGQYCREYSQTINVGGQKQEAFGRACRQPDGSWQIVE
jgi:surface antigen